MSLCILVAAAGPVRADAQAPSGPPAAPGTQSTAHPAWPRRVLLTNDDGIDSPALRTLAQSLAAAGIETYVAAPSSDRSGTGGLMTSLATDSVVTESRDLGPGITAWAVDAFPADCVLFALRGPMSADPPDLVLSGPNLGANVGEAWLISGTVGAARTAAFFGVPAIALSGADARDSLSIQTLARWAVKFVSSEPVRHLQAPQYLNVNVPVDPRSVRGTAVTERGHLLHIAFRRDTAAVDSVDGSAREVWRLGGTMDLGGAPVGTDAFAFSHDSVSIEALRVGEQDPAMQAWLRAHLELVPAWPLADTVPTAKKGGR